MSANFTGVTFAEQKVTPSDDAIIRRGLLSDGILTGCEISYSGSTLTIAAGQLMICGRQIKHPSAQNWAITDATSGYARILLTIDLSRTSARDTFDQVIDSVEYASSVTGFPALEKTDINAAGNRYQVPLCVVALGAGGITGIVSRLGTTLLAGGAVKTTQIITQTGEDVDKYTDTGIYFFIFGANPNNAPVQSNGWLIVLNASSEDNPDSYVKQIWLRAGTPGSNDMQMWVRTKGDSASTWGPWFTTLTNVLTSDVYGNSLPGNPVTGQLFFLPADVADEMGL